MKQVTGITTDQVDATVTYSLISAVGENVQYPHNNSSGISIFLDPIQWHSKRSILDTELQIYFNILHRISLAKRTRGGGGGGVGWGGLEGTTSYSGQSQVIRLKYIPWLRSQNFQSFKQFYTYLDERCVCFCTLTS